VGRGAAGAAAPAGDDRRSASRADPSSRRRAGPRWDDPPSYIRIATAVSSPGGRLDQTTIAAGAGRQQDV